MNDGPVLSLLVHLQGMMFNKLNAGIIFTAILTSKDIIRDNNNNFYVDIRN
jgi:hypothetical protein